MRVPVSFSLSTATSLPSPFFPKLCSFHLHVSHSPHPSTRTERWIIVLVRVRVFHFPLSTVYPISIDLPSNPLFVSLSYIAPTPTLLPSPPTLTLLPSHTDFVVLLLVSEFVPVPTLSLDCLSSSLSSIPVLSLFPLSSL